MHVAIEELRKYALAHAPVPDPPQNPSAPAIYIVGGGGAGECAPVLGGQGDSSAGGAEAAGGRRCG